METITTLLAILGALTFILLAFLALVWFGFRMGRQSIDKPLPAIIKPKQVNLVEEDPFWKPMTGEDQPSYPTVEGR